MTNKKKIVLDVECAPNYFLACFREIDGDRRRYFELYDGHPIDRNSIIKILRNFTIISFNGNSYDITMIKYALKQGVTNRELKKMNDTLIVKRVRPWIAEKEFNVPKIDWIDHIDLIEPAPSVGVSLKHYGGRLHSRRLQDLMFVPDEILPEDQWPLTVEYCFNDCEVTEDLYHHIEKQLDLRAEMSKQYGVDLRSKSDAQIAEAVIKQEIQRIKGEEIYRPEFPHDYTFQYQVPSFIRFKTQRLREVLHIVRNAEFGLKTKEVDDDSDEDDAEVDGVKVKISGIKMPVEIVGAKAVRDKKTRKIIEPKRDPLMISIGESTYKMGIGGLHSTEAHVCHFTDDDYIIRDADVASYYPAIVLNCELFPEHLGRDFLDVYRSIRERRIKAKRSGDKVTDLTLKIVLNGAFGKLGSKWSFLYSPNLMIQVTITGQLSLLMLIEELELNGISVISANTDGIVSKIPRHLEETYHAIVKDWEVRTGFEMEFADYASLYSMSVNSYIAFKPDGSVKQKGLYSFVGSKGSPAEKNPTSYVCIDAVINYLSKGTPFEDTIEWCPDIRRFLTVKRVTGGAMYQGKYVGKIVRWYYGKGCKEAIHYMKNGNKVGNSDGARLMMELQPGLPSDLDYDYYIKECRKMIGALGVL